MVATLALFGSALLTLVAGFLAARYDVRALLLCTSALMIGTGLAYAAANDYAVLLVVAFVGTINPSGGSTSVFVPLEHTVLSGAVQPARRTWSTYGSVNDRSAQCADGVRTRSGAGQLEQI